VRRFPLLLVCGFVLTCTIGASISPAQILHKKKKVDKSTDASNTVEPDKQLYDKAVDDIKHGRHEVGRLGLQTLINTYPDSEYLAKAKLSIADSYFKEGGTANITQAIAGYKDFIVFFPFLPEAAYAQMQVAMSNYNEMTKADRDSTHAHAAEEEFQTFLTKYPKDPLAPQAQQRLREVQEVLAEGQFRIAYYYYVKGDKRAAAGRLIPLTRRYPLYSQSDTALWMLGDIFERSERKDFAGFYYAQIVKNYPLSKHDGDAKAKLKAFGMPIPQADPRAVAWMTAEQNTPRPKESLIHKPMEFIKGGPDVKMAARNGAPNMEPESEADASTGDILKGGAHTTLVGGSTASGAGTTGIVATVKPGETAGSSENVTPASDDANTNTTQQDTNGQAAAPNAIQPEAAPATGTAPAAGTEAAPAAATTGTESTASTDAAPAAGTAAATSDTPAATDAAKTDGTQQPAQSDGKESSSKKKGLKKLIPW
jgi:outer membrane protein assembly factor BamD